MGENQNVFSNILPLCLTHTRIHTHSSHINTCSANTVMAIPHILSSQLPQSPNCRKIPLLICNSKFQKEHLSKEIKQIKIKS